MSRDRSPEPTPRDLSTPPPQTPIYRAAAAARRQEQPVVYRPVPFWLAPYTPPSTPASQAVSQR